MHENTDLNLNAEILSTLFQQEIPLVQDFLGLLEQENKLLQNFRSENLEAITNKKNQLLAQIGELENQRINLLNLPKQAEDNPKLKSQLIISATDNLIAEIAVPEISTLWEILRELSKNVQDLNSKNGNLLGMHLNQTNEILKILQHRGDNPTLYCKQGFTYSGKGGRIADEA